MDNPHPRCQVNPGECAVLVQSENWGLKYLVTNMHDNTHAQVMPAQYLAASHPEPTALRCSACLQECDRVLIVYEELDRQAFSPASPISLAKPPPAVVEDSTRIKRTRQNPDEPKN